jgi:uncharacterized membrane protein YgcG
MNRKLFFLIGLATLLFTPPVNAQSGGPPIPNPPPSNSYVLDTLNWLSESQEQEINTIARQLDSEGKAQIYVATLDDCGSDKTQYRRDFFNTWKIGTQKSDGGLLILVCWYRGDKSQRSVEVKTDEKMQSVIPNALTATTAENNFVPAFKENQPGVGLVNMVMVFDNVIRGEKPASLPFSPQQIITVGLIIVFGILLFFLFLRDKKGGSSSDGGWYDRGESGGGYSGGDDGGDSSTSF